MYIYANADEDKKQNIEKFLEDSYFYFQFDLDTLLSFETKEKEIEGGMYTLEYDNGEEAIEALEKEFRNICKK